MDVRPANVQVAGEGHQGHNGVRATDAEPISAAASEQIATASTSEPQIGGLALDPEPPRGVPVFVMLPLDTVNSEGAFRYTASKWFTSALECLKASGVHGMAIDVWWGAVERQPRRYDWSGYRQVIDIIKSLGLKVQAVMSFHACGGNVGDSAQVPLPSWVMKAGDQDPDIFHTDRPRDARLGNRNKEYVSIFADEAPRVLCGRSPLECYADFMHAFRDAFLDDVGSTIEEVVVGTGACGELRYPSYVEANGWRFPGIGEFQCYDRRALASLAQAAQEAGHPEWGYTGPHDAGIYTSTPEETGFFRGLGGSWDTPYGEFFLSWYSGALLAHGERLVKTATSIFNTMHPRRCTITNHNNSAQSIVNVGPAYGSPGGLQAPSSPAVLTTPGMSTDSAAASESPTDNDRGALAFSTGDLNTQMMERTTSNISAMSADSMAESADGAGQRRRVESVDMLESLAVQQQEQNGAQQRGPPGGGIWQPPPGLRRPSKSSASLSAVAADRDPPPPPSTRSEDGERRRVRVAEQPAGAAVEVSLKIAGIHWWYRTRSHAAELTAGYYNTSNRDGYNSLIEICAEHGAALTLTCVEMCDAQHPPEALCGPEGLLRQVREAAASAGVLLGGENALPCFSPGHVDAVALERIVYNTQAWSPPLQEENMREAAMCRGPSAGSLTGSGSSSDTLTASASAQGSSSAPDLLSKARNSRQAARPDLPQAELPMMRSFTFLRLTPEMLQPSYNATWARFMHRMRNNSTRGPSPVARTATGLHPTSARGSGGLPLSRGRSNMFVPNEKGEMVPSQPYIAEMQSRQTPPPWHQ
ncbi:g9512 [Coccomyxa elongata]